MRPRTVASLPVCLLLLLDMAPQPAAPESGAKIWVGRYREVEEYLRTAECIAMENYAGGNPANQRCVLRPGGPVSRMAWKPLIPGVYRGFRESYKTDIAAYELDKMLKMDMVPPAVERELQGHKGSATLWVENVVTSKNGTPPASDTARWKLQLARMMMFDNLIGNKDRNLANMLHDAAWNLILIDHSRAFGSGTDLPHSLTRIDPDYWARIETLTRQQLDATLGRWLSEDAIGAILIRRERMRAEIKK